MPTPIADPLGRLRLASFKISPRRMNQLDNRKRKQLSPPPLFLCFCLSPFFYLVILEKKKKRRPLISSQGQVGAGLVLGSGRHCTPRPDCATCPGTGPALGVRRPAGGGENSSCRCRVPGARPRDINTKVPWQQLCRAPPSGLDRPGSGTRVHWPEAQRGVAPHSALSRGHAPSPCSILAVEAQQLEESDVSPGKRLVPGP